MKFYYDLHIHSALSPCADIDMTPNNIVNMSILKGLDIIAVSDHNSVGNIEPVLKCAENTDLLVIPAMEIESAEEVHLLALFKDIECAQKVHFVIYEHLLNINNRPDIFGEQIFFDSNDNIIGKEEKLLVSATSLSVEKIKELVDNVGGVLIPAHIDRTSYSVLSNLGFIPEIGFKTLEISKNANLTDYSDYNFRIISNSDAHYLQDINERINSIELKDKSIKSVFELFKTNV